MNFWAGQFVLPLKRRVDAYYLTCARKKLRVPLQMPSTSPAGSSVVIIGVLPDGVGRSTPG